jgi:DNA-binding LacI/PurR family transcriptional regulator
LFDRPAPITAIVALDDYLAINIMRTLGRLGIRTPEDVSIVGFDNIELSSHVEVPLTTVAQNFYEIGVTSARMLFKRICGDYRAGGTVEVVPTEFVVRCSTAEAGAGLRSRNAVEKKESFSR